MNAAPAKRGFLTRFFCLILPLAMTLALSGGDSAIADEPVDPSAETVATETVATDAASTDTTSTDEPSPAPSVEEPADTTSEPSPSPAVEEPTPSAASTSDTAVASTSADTSLPVGDPTISSDKADYVPGAWVTLNGTNWVPGETVHIYVNDDVGQTWQRHSDVVADAGGTIEDAFNIPDWFVAVYRVVATASDGRTATTTFTDAPASLANDWKQCANNDPTSPLDPPAAYQCHWINSILQAANSDYAEGMIVPQRVVLPELKDSQGDLHTLLFSHQASKNQGGAAHAYDFISSWDDAVQTATALGFAPPLDLNACGVANAYVAECSELVQDNGTVQPGKFFLDVEVPQDGYVSGLFSEGDGDVQDRIDAYEATYGNRTIRIYGDAAITTANLVLSHTQPPGGDDDADDFIEYTLNFTTASTKVVVAFGGHLSVGHDGTALGWGVPHGASFISGGPYHFFLDGYRFFNEENELEFVSLGNQDNQIKAADLIAPGVKSGTKFNDLDGDGVKEAGEPGLPGWTINVYDDLDGDGILDAGEPITATDTTDASGNYSFSLAPGDYIACEVLQANWLQSYPNALTPDPTDEAITGCPGGTFGYAFTIVDGDLFEDNDFGNFSFATKTGIKFEDEAADGDFDAGTDTPLGGWVIRAYVDTNLDGDLDLAEFNAGAAFSDTTDAGTGAYSFTNLVPGTKYIICEVAQGGWTQSSPVSADDVCDVDAFADGLGPDGWVITLTPGQVDSGNNFGNFRQGTKSGFKYEDEDADGEFEAGDALLAGWKIFAIEDDNGDGQLDAGELSDAVLDTTDAITGAYSFSLDPGSYFICEETGAAGWTQSSPEAGDTDLTLECNDQNATADPDLAPAGYYITVTSDSEDTGNEFGNFRPAKLRVIKTVEGLPPTAEDGDILFQIREGASTAAGDNGTTLYFENANAANGGNIIFTDPSDHDGLLEAGESEVMLDPGTYQLCEFVPVGFGTTLISGDWDGDGIPGEYGDVDDVVGVGAPSGDWFTPGLAPGTQTSQVDNSFVCINIVISSGDDPRTITVDNGRPGMARTIGFWKNWTSCDGKGNQDPVLDDMIESATDNWIPDNGDAGTDPQPGSDGEPDIRLGDLVIQDNPATAVNEACTIAVDILDKRKVGTPGVVGDGAKVASNPAWNAASQLLAYELNQLLNPGDSCSAADTAAVLARRLLNYISFTGNTVDGNPSLAGNQNLTAGQKANLNYLAGILDDFNNNTLACGMTVTVPNPAALPSSAFNYLP